MASALFTDPGIASAATILSRAIAADDPYKDLSNLGSAAANTELAIQRRQQTAGAKAAADYVAANPQYYNTPEGLARVGSSLLTADPQTLAQFGKFNLALAAPTLGVESPQAAAFSQGAGVDTRGTGYGATRHETAETGRTSITAGAHVAAALGQARIAAAQREAEDLRKPRRPGDIIPPAEQDRWGIPAPIIPGQPVLEGSTESTTPSVTGPRGPFAFPTDATIASGSTRFDYSGPLLDANGNLREPTERRGLPATPEQLRAFSVAPLVAEAVANMTPEQRLATGGEALRPPTVVAAEVRAKGAIDAVKARAAALAAKTPNTVVGMRMKLVTDELEQAMRDPNLSDEAKQQLTAAASAKLDKIDQEHGAASGTVQAATLNAAERRAVAELAAKTRLQISDQSIAARVKIAEDTIAQRGAASDTQERIAQAKLDWLQERAGQTDQNARDLIDQKHAAKLEEIAAASAAKPKESKPLDTKQQAAIDSELARQLLPDIGVSLPNDPKVYAARLAGRVSSDDQRNAVRDLTLKANELMSSGAVKSPAEAVAQAKKELGYTKFDAPGSLYGTNPSFRVTGAATQAATTPAVTLPPAVVAQLGEGKHTKFANGQVWTLQNGKPVQVK